MALIREAAAQADGGDGFPRVHQQTAGSLDAQAAQVLLWRQAVLAEKAALKCPCRHAHGVRHFRIGHGFTQPARHQRDDDSEADISALVDLRGIQHACDACGADHAAPRIAHRLLGGEAPGGGVVIAAHQFQPALHRLPGQHRLVTSPEVRREMRGREVVVCPAQHLLQPLQAIVQQKGAVHPQVAAAGVLDPRLHVRQHVKKIAQGIGGGCGGGIGFHSLETTWNAICSHAESCRQEKSGTSWRGAIGPGGPCTHGLTPPPTEPTLPSVCDPGWAQTREIGFTP